MIKITQTGIPKSILPDCGKPTKKIWGYVDNEEGAYAVYYAWWTPGHPERGAQQLLSIGGWGEGVDPSQKQAVGVNSRMGDDRPGFEVVDAKSLALSSAEFLGKMLSRAEAFSTGAAAKAFHIIDHLVYEDRRLNSFYRHGA